MSPETSMIDPQELPRIAREMGFNFSLRRGRVDWNKIDSINVDRLVQDRDLITLHENLLNVVNYNLDREYDVKILDPNFVKLFKLAQLSIDYLMYSQQHLFNCLEVINAVNEGLQKDLEKRDKNVKLWKRRMKENICASPSHIAHIHQDIFECNFCGKKFWTPGYLSSHLARRHPGSFPSTAKQPELSQSEVEVLRAEIQQLRDLLTNIAGQNGSTLRNESVRRTEAESLQSEIQQLRDLSSSYVTERLDEPVRRSSNTEESNENRQLRGSLTSRNVITQQSVDNMAQRVSHMEESNVHHLLKYREEVESIKAMFLSEIKKLNDAKQVSAPATDPGKDQNHQLLDQMRKREVEFASLRDQDNIKARAEMETFRNQMESQECFWKSRLLDLQQTHSQEIGDLRLQFKSIASTIDSQNVEKGDAATISRVETQNEIPHLTETYQNQHQKELEARENNARSLAPRIQQRKHHLPSKSTVTKPTNSDISVLDQHLSNTLRHSPLQTKLEHSRSANPISIARSPHSVEPSEPVVTQPKQPEEPTQNVIQVVDLSESDISDVEYSDAIQESAVEYFTVPNSPAPQTVLALHKVSPGKDIPGETKRQDARDSSSDTETSKEEDEPPSKQDLVSPLTSSTPAVATSKPPVTVASERKAGGEQASRMNDNEGLSKNWLKAVKEESREPSVTSTEESTEHSELQGHTVSSMQLALHKNPQILAEFKVDVREQFHGRLRELGVDPEWEGIPLAKFTRTMDTVEHHQAITAKRLTSFFKLKQSLSEKVSRMLQSKQPHKVVSGDPAASGPSVLQPSFPRPSVPQPSVPQPSIPRPSIPQPSVTRPAEQLIQNPLSIFQAKQSDKFAAVPAARRYGLPSLPAFIQESPATVLESIIPRAPSAPLESETNFEDMDSHDSFSSFSDISKDEYDRNVSEKAKASKKPDVPVHKESNTTVHDDVNEGMKLPRSKALSRSDGFLVEPTTKNDLVSPRSALKSSSSTGSLVTKKRVIFSDLETATNKPTPVPRQPQKSVQFAVEEKDSDEISDFDDILLPSDSELATPSTSFKHYYPQERSVARISQDIEHQLSGPRSKPVGGVAVTPPSQHTGSDGWKSTPLTPKSTSLTSLHESDIDDLLDELMPE